MEIIVAIISGVVLGCVIGFFFSKVKNQDCRSLVEKLQWQLENDKLNAAQQITNLQQQMEVQKVEAKENLEVAKQEAEVRIAQVKVEAERQTKAALEAQEVRYTQTLQSQKQQMTEAMTLVEAKAKEMQEAQELRHRQEIAAQQERLADAEKKAQEMMAAQERNHEQALTAQQERFDEMMQKVSAQLKTATDDMLKQRQKEFAESSNTNLGQIVTPLRETIEKMKQTMNESTLKHTELSAAMKENLENMMKQSEAAKQSADELARVFKHKSKVQGNWGERVLEELLDSQGLQCGIHYERECVIRDAAGNVVKTDTGGNLRPDVILHLDNNREIIIDSKVSLTAFMDYVNAETDEARQDFLKLHIDSIQKHVKELSKKDYSSYIQAPKQKMDYVIMFVPHTGALWTALNAQPDLWRKAMEMNVFIADEQTLFAALRMINLTWTQIKQAENHKEVYKLANEMIKRVGMFIKNYDAVGKALNNARAAYEEGEKKLADKGQSIILTCNQLEALGAKQHATYPVPQLGAVELTGEEAS